MLQTVFSQANISPVEGTELIEALGLDAWELQKPDVFKMYLDVAKYLEKFSDAGMIARTVGRSAPKAEKLAKMAEYVALRKSLDEVRQARAELPKIDMISSETPELLQKRQELDSREASLISEIRRYE